MVKLNLEGKITIFKSLAVSKTPYLALLTTIPNSVIEELKQIQKMFLWGNRKPKIKHCMLCNKYKDGSLKDVDKVHKVMRLKCTWGRRLCYENFHEWTLIPLRYINKYIGKEFSFQSNIKISNNILGLFPLFYKEIIDCWSIYYYQAPTLLSAIGSQYLWCTNCVNIHSKMIYFREI